MGSKLTFSTGFLSEKGKRLPLPVPTDTNKNMPLVLHSLAFAKVKIPEKEYCKVTLLSCGLDEWGLNDSSPQGNSLVTNIFS